MGLFYIRVDHGDEDRFDVMEDDKVLAECGTDQALAERLVELVNRQVETPLQSIEWHRLEDEISEILTFCEEQEGKS